MKHRTIHYTCFTLLLSIVIVSCNQNQVIKDKYIYAGVETNALTGENTAICISNTKVQKNVIMTPIDKQTIHIKDSITLVNDDGLYFIKENYPRNKELYRTIYQTTGMIIFEVCFAIISLLCFITVLVGSFRE